MFACMYEESQHVRDLRFFTFVPADRARSPPSCPAISPRETLRWRTLHFSVGPFPESTSVASGSTASLLIIGSARTRTCPYTSAVHHSINHSINQLRSAQSKLRKNYKQTHKQTNIHRALFVACEVGQERDDLGCALKSNK